MARKKEVARNNTIRYCLTIVKRSVSPFIEDQEKFVAHQCTNLG